jgi:hypothetical protein
MCGQAALAPSAQGSSTTFVQWSSLSLKTSYILGASSIGTRWLTTKLGVYFAALYTIEQRLHAAHHVVCPVFSSSVPIQQTAFNALQRWNACAWLQRF